VEETAFSLARRLQRAWNDQTGLFYRSVSSRSPIRATASFATQIYPVYALSLYGKAARNQQAISIATACANRLCLLQEPDGGWPWMYDVRRGSVVDKAPIYSVHQHGMAPMALLQVERASARLYSEAVCRSIRWLRGPNAMDVSMVDEQLRTIWRAQEPSLPFRLPRATINVMSTLAFGKPLIKRSALRIMEECRPYELGWLMNAAYL
jgi:hypothetical protein